MAQAGRELWGPDAVLVPVPLHRVRLFSRRYNQSTELARALGKLTGLPSQWGCPAPQCRWRVRGAS
jgi:predicted amidophosphoribosyltransferase